MGEAGGGEVRPELTIILDVAPKEGLARAASRRQATGQRADRFEAEDDAFHEELRRAFLDIAEQEPERCCVVNGGMPYEEVARAIRQLVDARFLDQPASAVAR
jgi:dTMP kinase